MSAKDKWIRRFSVDETVKHKNGFTIYKITSVLFPLQSPEAVSSVSVWKRYSDVERLHKSMRSLHAGLHLHGTFPTLPRYSYFKRFQQEFIAEHRLLFTSTEFVNFLQELPTGVDETDFISQIPIYEAAEVELRPSPINTKVNSYESLSSIESIDSDLYDELSKLSIEKSRPSIRRVLPDLINFDVPSTSKFEDYHTRDKTGNTDSEDYHTRVSTGNTNPDCHRVTTGNTDSDYHNRFTSGNTDSEDYHTRFSTGNTNIDYHTRFTTGNTDSDTTSLNSNLESSSMCEFESRSSMSLYSKRSALSLSNAESKTRTEDSYVFEAGYMLNLAARCEDMGDFQRAFECYKVAETRTPVLPTVIPYMVPLHAYIETNNLLFLILSYAPGEKLFDYIKNYAKSLPTTPSRVVNLENVFAEPKNKFDSENNINSDNVDSANVDSANVDNRNVDELVLKSQKLLLNVDKVLTESGDNMTDNDNGVCEVPRSVKQIILTYFTSYHGADMSLATLRAKSGGLYVAPELYRAVADCAQGEGGRGVLERLLTYEPSERLGAGEEGIHQIKQHPYFKSVDWQMVYDSWIVPD
ncbi:Ribosomal protein S6 kinase-like 1 [Operophtera brumata]|uniref:Ribosomal protein S6 kinase-like 1 n=1 Tax=Operophtera brumata TaxID=104452 RepID=A0A0L7LUZ7_OPEBR|nr:Ribosomal protein S6 kinase-like 1 [Operophtera brumata]